MEPPGIDTPTLLYVSGLDRNSHPFQGTDLPHDTPPQKGTAWHWHVDLYMYIPGLDLNNLPFQGRSMNINAVVW